MVDMKQVNVDRLSPAFFSRTSPTCSVQNTGWTAGPSREDNVQEHNRRVFKDKTEIFFRDVCMCIHFRMGLGYQCVS